MVDWLWPLEAFWTKADVQGIITDGKHRDECGVS